MDAPLKTLELPMTCEALSMQRLARRTELEPSVERRESSGLVGVGGVLPPVGRFSVTCELPLITCSCEMEFALMAHFIGEDDHGEKEDRWMYQDCCYFCPYCGKKNEKLSSPNENKVSYGEGEA